MKIPAILSADERFLGEMKLLTKTSTHDQGINLEILGIWPGFIGMYFRVVGKLGVVFLNGLA